MLESMSLICLLQSIKAGAGEDAAAFVMDLGSRGLFHLGASSVDPWASSSLGFFMENVDHSYHGRELSSFAMVGTGLKRLKHLPWCLQFTGNIAGTTCSCYSSGGTHAVFEIDAWKGYLDRHLKRQTRLSGWEWWLCKYEDLSSDPRTQGKYQKWWQEPVTLALGGKAEKGS